MPANTLVKGTLRCCSSLTHKICVYISVRTCEMLGRSKFRRDGGMTGKSRWLRVTGAVVTSGRPCSEYWNSLTPSWYFWRSDQGTELVLLFFS